MRTEHPVHGFSFLSQEAHQSTVWSARHLPQNRDVFMTSGGNAAWSKCGRLGGAVAGHHGS